MFPPSLDYRRADSVESAVGLLADREDARPIAGGQGLIPDLKLGKAAPGLLVDVGALPELSGIEVERADGGDADDVVVVGAGETHADLRNAEVLADRAPALAATAPHVADRQVSNRGTLGGNLAEADPDADWPAPVLAADATVVAQGPDGERTIPAGEFFAGDGATALSGDELLTAVRVPAHDRGGYARKTHPASGYAMVGVAAALWVEAGTVTDARVAATGVADRPVRLGSVEAALDGEALDAVDPEVAAADAPGDLDPADARGDVHASGGFRRELLAPFAERALADALS